MKQIRLGLQKGIDVSPYLNSSMNWKEMKEFRLELQRKKK